MDRKNEAPVETLIDLGSVTDVTHGNKGPVLDAEGSIFNAGLSDD
jgi:hypothetical protein